MKKKMSKHEKRIYNSRREMMERTSPKSHRPVKARNPSPVEGKNGIMTWSDKSFYQDEDFYISSSWRESDGKKFSIAIPLHHHSVMELFGLMNVVDMTPIIGDQWFLTGKIVETPEILKECCKASHLLIVDVDATIYMLMECQKL